MGLDVYHYKLTTEPGNRADSFTLEDWDLDCNVPLAVYAPYITKVKSWEILHSIAIVKNEQDYDTLLQSVEADREKQPYAKIFVGQEPAMLRKEIEALIKKNKWEHLERLDMEVTMNKFSHYDISFSEVAYADGLYYTEAGYQRKGMNNRFYELFEAYLLWGKKEDFELALSCIGNDWYIAQWGMEAVNKMREEFKAGFVDSFVYGQSLLCASI